MSFTELFEKLRLELGEVFLKFVTVKTIIEFGQIEQIVLETKQTQQQIKTPQCFSFELIQHL